MRMTATVAPRRDVADMFASWQRAQDAADELRRDLVGRRVQYVGITGVPLEGGTGVVTRVASTGVRVRWTGTANMGQDVVCPRDLRLIGGAR